jgi:aspartyl-tRNA(Asn)/glutamyl-tRNA(Gln) amidotransferase subunit A
MTDELCHLTISEVGEGLRSGKFTAVDLVDAFAQRHESLGEVLNCYGLFLGERARRQAEALDSLLGLGVDLGPLHGVPIAVKDNVDTRGIPSTNGSPIYRGRVPEADATVIHRLQQAGAIILGKANLYEWAYGSPSALFGDVGNPWRPSHTAGASSNGSAAAVAAGLATAAIGTDLGGSIRIPAAMCGIYGLKPTYGLISRFGVLPNGQTLDHVGPMTHTAHDAQVLLEAIAGPDPKDPVSLGGDAPLPAGSVRGMRIGIARPQDGHEVTREVADAVAAAAEVFTLLGAIVTDVDLPSLDDARTAMWTISAVEGAEFHLPILRAANDQYSDKARRLLLGGLLIPGVDYARCQRVRAMLADAMNALFADVSVVLSPVLRSPAWDAGRATIDYGQGPEDNMSAMTHFSPLYNLTGHPAATFLAGFSNDGLPIGLQLAAPLHGEAILNATVSAFEAETGYTQRRPPV